MFARDLMTKPVITVSPKDSLSNAAKLLRTHHMSGAPVVAHDGTIVGVLAQRDMAPKTHKSVQTVMNRDFISVTEDDSIEAVAQLLSSRKLELLPVLRGNTVVGIISQDDIVTAVGMGVHSALQAPLYDL
jgi:predicted transcriptional regulator